MASTECGERTLYCGSCAVAVLLSGGALRRVGQVENTGVAGVQSGENTYTETAAPELREGEGY